MLLSRNAKTDSGVIGEINCILLRIHEWACHSANDDDKGRHWWITPLPIGVEQIPISWGICLATSSTAEMDPFSLRGQIISWRQSNILLFAGAFVVPNLFKTLQVAQVWGGKTERLLIPKPQTAAKPCWFARLPLAPCPYWCVPTE
jgi:hypothetical protein